MVKLRSLSVAVGHAKNQTLAHPEAYATVKKSGPVAYNSGDWGQIIFQCFGSAWPKVLPFCLLNTLSVIIFMLLRDHDIIDCSLSSQAHTYGSVVLSFLLVSRINTALARYNESRGFIGIMYQETRELIQYAICLSKHYGNMDKEAREWRNELAYRSMILLRMAIAVVEFCSKGQPAWKCKELTGIEKLYMTPDDSWSLHSQATSESEYTNSMRVPFRAAFLVRETVTSNQNRLKTPLHITQMNAMLTSVDRFMSGFYGYVMVRRIIQRFAAAL
mmetsp:Transcript_7191/g.10916  ORF Transcript_7191/g.10916 Transcript_7191/m.10916 type:complete len:274 (+) Transcript_7191:140-961(+)